MISQISRLLSACPKLNQISFLDISRADFISDAHRTRLPVCRPSVPSNMDSLLTVSWAKLQTSPLSPSREQSVHTQSHSWNRPFKCYSMLSRDTAELCPPSSPEWATQKWADVLGEAADTRWPGSLNWHRFASDEESDEDRMVYEFASKSGGRQLTGNVSARHQNSKKAHFSVSYLYSV